MSKKAGTPFTQTLIEIQCNERVDRIKQFLDSDYIFESSQGYEIDVLKLVDRLNSKQKKALTKYLTKQQCKNK